MKKKPRPAPVRGTNADDAAENAAKKRRNAKLNRPDSSAGGASALHQPMRGNDRRDADQKTAARNA